MCHIHFKDEFPTINPQRIKALAERAAGVSLRLSPAITDEPSISERNNSKVHITELSDFSSRGHPADAVLRKEGVQ